MGQYATLRRSSIDGFEHLHEVVVGVRRDILQIERGRIHGELLHASVGDLPIDAVTFSLGVRSRGSSSRDRTALSLLLDSSKPVTLSRHASRPGDVMVLPRGAELENRYYGGASLLVISPSDADIEACFGADAEIIHTAAAGGRHFEADAEMVSRTVPRLRALVDRLGGADLDTDGADFWKRAVIEAMTANVMNGAASGPDGPLPSALRLVRRVEDYLDAEPARAIHISKICGELKVSRRSLHRAFHEALGIGPIAFLRHRRLCAVHTALRSGTAAGESIADLAMRYGFLHVGRFAGYYRHLFGEYPHQTRYSA
jgi:AraC family ethanolamine operon transcriptional activator